MIVPHRGITVFAYCRPADMRKGFEGLSSLVRNELDQDPLSGALYLFTNRTRSRAKVLCFDGTGLCIYAKRLEKGRFAALWQRADDSGTVKLTASELALFLEGSVLVGTRSLSPRNLSMQDLAVGI